ncbi:MAG: rod shape-determining protein MreC [Chlamydiia bacterium]
MEWTHPLTRFRPLTVVLGALICALSLPGDWVQKIRGGAAWCAAPLWAAAASWGPSMSREEWLEERVHALELDQLQLQHRLQELAEVPAAGSIGVRVRVLAREAGAWHRFLWIDAGRETCSKEQLRLNSPVVQGDALVGVVDYVGRRQSLVRLITDPGCCPAIEVGEHGPETTWKVLRVRLEELLSHRASISPHARQQLLQALSACSPSDQAVPRMQGTMLGMREREGGSPRLRGQLFHAEWVAKITSGVPLQWPEAGHLLLTSGLDGIFPSGLRVGYLLSLNEEPAGEPTRGFVAVPVVEDLDELRWLTVLPPGRFSQDDRPGPPWVRALEGSLSKDSSQGS